MKTKQEKSVHELEQELNIIGKAHVKLFGGIVALSWAFVGLILVYSQNI